MRLQLEYEGQVHNIYAAIQDNGTSPALEFLNRIKRNTPASHKSMVNRYERYANHGTIRNTRISRHITNRGNLYEFKTHQGDRLLYFNHPNGGIVLTNGFHKGDPDQRAFDRAENFRDSILEKE